VARTRALLDEGDKWKAADSTIPKMNFGTSAKLLQRGFRAGWSPTLRRGTTRRRRLGRPNCRLLRMARSGFRPWNDELYLEFHRGPGVYYAEQSQAQYEGGRRLRFSTLRSMPLWRGWMASLIPAIRLPTRGRKVTIQPVPRF